MQKTLTYEQIEKEFDELFVKKVMLIDEPDKLAYEEMKWQVEPEAIKSFLKQSFIKYLQSECERLGKVLYQETFYSKWQTEKEKLTDNSTKEEAISFIEKIIPFADSCPFCGQIPKFTYSVGERSGHGSVGHFTQRIGCCDVTASGQTELFFCNDNKKEDYGLWAGLMFWQIVKWNSRNNQSISDQIKNLQAQIKELEK